MTTLAHVISEVDMSPRSRADQRTTVQLPPNEVVPADRQATRPMAPDSLLPAETELGQPTSNTQMLIAQSGDPDQYLLDTQDGDVRDNRGGPAAESTLKPAARLLPEQTEGLTTCDDLQVTADRPPPRRRSLMGHYALQLLDVQKLRVAQANRVHAMERDVLPEPWIEAGRTVLADLEKLEAFCNRQLEKQGAQHFMAQWIKDAPGISLAGFARLIGLTGPLDNFATVSKLWAYCGLHVVDGSAPKRRKGELANWSPAARVLCHQIAESVVKVGRGPYREAYDRKKLDYEMTHPEWTPLHRHQAAMRYAVKELLKDLWREWHHTDTSSRPAA